MPTRFSTSSRLASASTPSAPSSIAACSALRAALDDDERDVLPPELVRDDAADAAVAADDEVILDRFEHTFVPAPLQPLGQPALDDDRREQREGVERRADAAAASSDDGERLAGPRQLRGPHGSRRS